MRRRAGAARGAARSRRTPVRPGGGRRGLRVPWVPVLLVAGVAVVAGAVVFLIIQAGQEGSSGFDEAAQIEADLAPDLPGEHVDLQSIYDGFYGNTEGNNTANHVREEVDYSEQGLPPTGGPHWGSGACPEDPDDASPFCGPVPWGIYREPWPAESLVHNMEHGGLVLWYNTTNQQVIDELEDLIADELGNDVLIVMTPYPDMEAETIAVTGWARRDKFPVSEYTKERVDEFIDVHKCRFNPEDLSGSGC